jgi:hypothetical protein
MPSRDHAAEAMRRMLWTMAFMVSSLVDEEGS